MHVSLPIILLVCNSSKCFSNPGKWNRGSIVAEIHRDGCCERNQEEAAEAVERREAITGKEHVQHQDAEQ